MEQEILDKLKENEQKLDLLYASVEKTRKYFLWSLIFNILVFFLPLLGLIFIIPWFLKSIDYASMGL